MNCRGRGRGQDKKRAANNGPLSGIGLRNGLEYSNAKTFIPNEAYKITRTAPTNTPPATIMVRNIFLALILIISC